MDIGGIGEFSLIASIRRRMEGKYPPEVALGIGDDCAVLHPQAGMEWVITTDTQVEDVHFRRAWLTPYQIGWRAMAVNLSDIAAMGAQPFGALAALALPVATEAAFFDQLLDGLCDLGSALPMSAHRRQSGSRPGASLAHPHRPRPCPPRPVGATRGGQGRRRNLGKRPVGWVPPQDYAPFCTPSPLLTPTVPRYDGGMRSHSRGFARPSFCVPPDVSPA